jgi:RNA polymerase sigma-70 factor, ECF subfamily
MLQNFDHLTDEELARGVQQGDVFYFEHLVERYEDRIMRYARRFLLSEQDAEDAVQEVFIKAYTNIRSFDAARKFSPWLYRIAHNEFLNGIRKKKHDPIPFFDPDTLLPHPVAPEQTDHSIKAKELKELMSVNLDKLSPKYREPLVLFYFQDLSYQEISDILQIPVSTVGVRINRAKSSLRQILLNSNDVYEPRAITD